MQATDGMTPVLEAEDIGRLSEDHEALRKVIAEEGGEVSAFEWQEQRFTAEAMLGFVALARRLQPIPIELLLTGKPAVEIRCWDDPATGDRVYQWRFAEEGEGEALE